MAGELQPLDDKFAIVRPDGRPTLYFIEWAQQRQIDITDAITLEILQQYLDDHALQEGSGIQITPSGSLNDSPTIAADVQEILDQITTTQGSIVYRNASDWVALAPGTAGQFLKTNGAGADPAWAAGGAGAMTLIEAYTGDGTTGTKTFSSIPSTYKDLLLRISGRTSAAVGVSALQIRVNGLSTAIYDIQRQFALNTTNTADQSLGQTGFPGAGSASFFALPGTSTAAGDIAGGEMIFQDYAGTAFNKLVHGRARHNSSTTTHDGYVLHFTGQVRLTSAISSISVALASGNYVTGTKIELYGIG